MNRLKKARQRLLTLALSLAPTQLLHALDQLAAHHALNEPQNPLRDAVGNRLSLFGTRR